jgi:hypothetical protein
MSVFVFNTLRLEDDGLEKEFSGQVDATNSERGFTADTPPISTAVTNLSTASLSAVGYAFLRSLSTATSTPATQTITVGRLDGTNFVAFCRLRPNESGVIRLAPGSYAAQAAVEGDRLLFAVIED